MDTVKPLIEKYFSGSDSDLRLGGCRVSDLATKYGTPFYAYDSQVLAQKWVALRSVLPPEFGVYYAIKANPNPAILNFFLERGAGLEIASLGEFNRAIAAGCAPQNILFAGPSKTEAELEAVLRQGIGAIHVESPLEIKRVSAISQNLGVPAHIALRVNPKAYAQGGAMRMGGKPLPFGIDEEQLPTVLAQVERDPYLVLLGIHLFIGTQILDAAVLLHQYRQGIQIARGVAQVIQSPLCQINLGGGWGIPYFTNDVELDLGLLQTGLEALMAEVRHDPHLSGTQFIVEPGRYLVGEGGIYVVRVNDIKVSRGKKFLIVDGGMHHHLAASGNLGQVIKRNYPVAILNKLATAPQETVDVVGPLCTPLDVLARTVTLPPAAVGDLIGIFQSGAYALSASPVGFLSHSLPAEVWVEPGGDRLISPQSAGDREFP